MRMMQGEKSEELVSDQLYCISIATYPLAWFHNYKSHILMFTTAAYDRNKNDLVNRWTKRIRTQLQEIQIIKNFKIIFMVLARVAQ